MAKSALKRLVAAADRLGALDMALRSLATRKCDFVLSLHSVSPRKNHVLESIHPADLDLFLSRLGRIFEFAAPEDLSSPPKGKGRIVLSFDDGYLDFAEHAMPVLEKHGIRANLNVIVGCLETGRPMWNVDIYDFLTEAPLSLLKEIGGPGDPDFRWTDGSLNERRHYARRLMNRLKWKSREERIRLMEPLRRAKESQGYPFTAMMGLPELQHASSRHEIGCHSFSHDTFGAEPDAFFRDDFRRCHGFFSSELKLPLRTYAFPNGSFKKSQVEWLVRESGVERVFLVEEAANQPGNSHSAFSRITLYGDNPVQMKLRLLRAGSGKSFSGLPDSSAGPANGYP